MIACTGTVDGRVDGAVGPDGSTDGTVDTDGATRTDGGSDAGVPTMDGLRPSIFDFRVETAYPDRVYFTSSEALQVVEGGSLAGFILTPEATFYSLPDDPGPIERRITGIEINADSTTGHYFQTDTTFTYWDNHCLRYEGTALGEPSGVRDSEGNALVDFSLSYVRNDIEEPTPTTTRYVASTASGSGDGASEGDPWTLTQAFSNATAGTVVWIKAGTYTGNYELSNSGTVDEPIEFVGYRDSIGDITERTFAYGDSLSAAEAPLLDGGNRRVSTPAIRIRGRDFIIMKNLQITRHGHGILNRERDQDGFVAQNIVMTQVGDYLEEIFSGYSPGGTGFLFANQNARIKRLRIEDCTVVNASAANFHFFASNSAIIGCESYANEGRDDNDAALTTDYYYLLNGSYNMVVDSLAHKDISEGHFGHGISFKGLRGPAGYYPTEYNLARGNTVINCGWGIQARWNAAKRNVYRGNLIHAGVPNRRGSSFGQTGFMLMDGASENLFENNIVRDTDNAFSFADTTEDTQDTQTPHDNVIRNNVFHNLAKNFIMGGGLNNLFHHNTIYDVGGEIFGRPVTSTGSEFENNIVADVADSNAADGWTIDTNNYFGSAPVGIGSTTDDPLFVDAAGGDFHLGGGSPVIDIGLPLSAVGTDFDGVDRPQGGGYDLGAFEWRAR